MFNALGKSRIPLYFLIFSSIFNVILDIIMVTKMGYGSGRCCLGNADRQGISAVLSFGVLLKNLKGTGRKSRRPCLQKWNWREMTRIAIPSILSAVYGFYLV